jgi:hypothetical protein
MRICTAREEHHGELATTLGELHGALGAVHGALGDILGTPAQRTI